MKKLHVKKLLLHGVLSSVGHPSKQPCTYFGNVDLNDLIAFHILYLCCTCTSYPCAAETFCTGLMLCCGIRTTVSASCPMALCAGLAGEWELPLYCVCMHTWLMCGAVWTRCPFCDCCHVVGCMLAECCIGVSVLLNQSSLALWWLTPGW